MNLLETKDFKSISVVYLQFGPECNMQCRHCHQTPEKEISFLVKKPTDEVMQFLDNYIQFSQGSQFKDKGTDWMPACRVSFWGGEPLLHWNVIKEIVKLFTEKYDILSTRAFRFAVTTNGLGINEEFVEFVNKYKVIVNFSYDAPYPWAVRGYVSDRICNFVNKINYARIISSGCSWNCDPLLAHRCLLAKFPNAKQIVRTEVLRTFPELDKDVDAYDTNKLRNSIRRLFIGAKMNDYFCYRYLKNMFTVKVFPEKNYFHNTKGLGVCISGRKELTVSLDGTVSFCYNSCEALGNLKEDTLDTIFQKASKIWHDIYDPQCEDCECRDMCYWGCILLLRDKNKHAFGCDLYRKPFFKIVKEEMVKLVSPLTEEEKEWYAEQEKIMEQQVQDFLAEGQRYEREHTRFPKEMDSRKD